MPIISNFPSANDNTSLEAHLTDQNAHSGKINNSLIATNVSVSSANLITVSAIAGISSYSELPNQFSLFLPSVTAGATSGEVTLKLLDGSTIFNVNYYSGTQMIGNDIIAGKPMLLLINKTTGEVIFASGASADTKIASNRCLLEFTVVNSSAQSFDLTSLKVVITSSSGSESANPNSNGKVIFDVAAADYTVTVNNLVSKTQMESVTLPSASILGGTAYSTTINIIDKLVVTQGFIIDTSNSDPSGAITYCDDSVGMTAGSIAWMDVWPFNAIFPCVHAYNASKSVITKASRNNPLQSESGTTLSTADGNNHFTVFPLMWIKFTALSSTQYKVQITNTEPTESGWMRYPYDTNYNATAIGRYEGSYSSNRLGSRPSQTVKVSATRANFRTYAKANSGAGHTLVDFDMETIMETLYLLYFKSFDSQTKIGKGATSNSAAIKTGTMDSKNTGSVASHLYGDQTGTTGMKFLWIENWYGNTWEFVDGINIISYVAYICHVIANYADDTTTNYTNAGTVPSSSGSYPTRGLYTNNGRFLPSAVGGSTSTYYCDIYYINSGNRVACFGGVWVDGAGAGAFYWDLDYDSSYSYSYLSGRLGCYLQLND